MFFVALIAFSCLFAWNGWAIEYDLESVKDITINYTDELVKPEPKAYLKGKVLCKDGFQLEVLVDTEAKEGQIGRFHIT